MRLIVSTPLAVVLDTDNVAHVRAEDASGAFGILLRHADFLTTLAVSVLTWRDTQGREHHVAVRGGMLAVRGGDLVSVATPEAVAGDDLQRLETDVLSAFRRQLSDEQADSARSQRLHLAAIRQIVRFLRPQRTASVPFSALAAELESLES